MLMSNLALFRAKRNRKKRSVETHDLNTWFRLGKEITRTETQITQPTDNFASTTGTQYVGLLQTKSTVHYRREQSCACLW